MKENYFYIGATISSALSFIENLIPILQVILLCISLILTLSGIFNSIMDKYKKNEDITDELNKGIDVIKTTSKEIEEKIKEVNKDGKD